MGECFRVFDEAPSAILGFVQNKLLPPIFFELTVPCSPPTVIVQHDQD